MNTPLEQKLISSYKAEMIAYMHAHPAAFAEAAALAVSDKQPYAWRSAWLLWSCLRTNDRRMRKHINEFIRYLPLAQDNQKRELLKILLMMELNEEQQTTLFDECMLLWTDITKAPSIRVNAIKMMLKIAKHFPELNREVSLSAQPHYLATLSPGARTSVAKLLHLLDD